MSWNDGYRTDLTYTYGYYGDMNPAIVHFCLIMSGYMAPKIMNACELGYGQGLSINIHAAAETTTWYGTDFNPAQAAFAQDMASASGARVHCFADSFHKFCERKDLPQFDFIALHGIWSWISRSNQDCIIDLVDRHLAPGGALYISYNALPGWTAFQPVRQLMQLFAARMDQPGSAITDRIAHSYDFIEQVMKTGGGYFQTAPKIQERLQKMKEASQAYVAHELFNQDWEPCYFSDMAERLGEARMTFACPADPLRCIDGLGLSAEQKQLLAQVNDPILRETLRDFIYNTTFRKDIWIKGPRMLNSSRHTDMLRQEQVVLLTLPDKLEREVKTPVGNISLSRASFEIIKDVLWDGKPHSFAEMEKYALELLQKPEKPENIDKENLHTLAQACAVLQAGGLLTCAQSASACEHARATSAKLNMFIASQALDSANLAFMASPVTGGGISVGRFSQLFWLARKNGAKDAQAMGAYALNVIRRAGQNIVLDGREITDQAEALSYMEKQAEEFLIQILPILKNMQIA